MQTEEHMPSLACLILIRVVIQVELKAGLVEYYDPSVFSGNFSEGEAVFRKRKALEHQRGYRFTFDTGIPRNDPLKLQIGNISDIAVLCSTSEVNDLLPVRLKFLHRTGVNLRQFKEIGELEVRCAAYNRMVSSTS